MRKDSGRSRGRQWQDSAPSVRSVRWSHHIGLLSEESREER
jgi:hypothetical protein